MKRNENLLIFSHEHHHGLIFCSRLQKINKVSDSVLKDFIMDFWDNYLNEHFINEEKLFLPLLDNEELTTQFLQEHKLINDLVLKIKNASTGLHAYAHELSQLINDHIRFEERVFFPWLENKFSVDDLIKIGKQLAGIEVSEHQFPTKFWVA